jgi:hypothetical protein
VSRLNIHPHFPHCLQPSRPTRRLNRTSLLSLSLTFVHPGLIANFPCFPFPAGLADGGGGCAGPLHITQVFAPHPPKSGLQCAVSRSSSICSGNTHFLHLQQSTALSVTSRNAASLVASGCSAVGFSDSSGGVGYNAYSVDNGTKEPQHRGGWYGDEANVDVKSSRRHSAWYVCWPVEVSYGL